MDDIATPGASHPDLDASGPYEEERSAARSSTARSSTARRRRPPPGHARRRPSVLQRHAWWLVAVAAFVVSKTISTILVIAETLHLGGVPIVGPQQHLGAIGSQQAITVFGTTVVSGARGALGTWDGLWYLAAAEHGWPHHVNPHLLNTTGFFPAVPLSIRWTHDLLGLNWTWSGLVATTVLELVAVLAVAFLARQVFGDRVARRAAILFALFPGAYVFALIYSEPLFIVSSALCLIFLGRRQWVLAGVAAAVAGATRSSGIIMVLVCAWVALRELRTRPLRESWRSLVAVVLSPIGFLGFLAFLRGRTGSISTYSETQVHAWNQKTSFLALYKDVANLGNEAHGQETWVGMVFLVLALVALVLLILQVRRGLVPSEWVVYSLGIIGTCLTSEQLGALRPRFALAAFPLLIGVAARLRGWQTAVLAVVFAGFLGLLAWTLPLYVP